MAFTYDNINDMENIAKATGLTEDELANLIIAKENEGWTNAEIAELLVSNFDNKEYAGKGQDELDAIYSLGFNPPKDYNPAGGKRYQQWQEYEEDPSLFDRFKSWYGANKEADEQRRASEREAIANSVTDWRDSHPEQWRVGMVNAMFGDNSLLSQYYSTKNAAEEGEKNRQSQREYNEYLREYDRNTARAEELKEAKLELAQLNRDLVTAKPADRAELVKRIEAISEKYPELDASSEEAQRANDAERAYQAEKTGYISEMPTSFKTIDEQRLAIEDVMKSNLRSEDKEKAVAELRSIKPLSLQQTEASFGAIAGHAGKKTTESLDDSDLTKKAEDAIKNNTSPARLTSEVLDKIRELNYTWKNNKWSKR